MAKGTEDELGAGLRDAPNGYRDAAIEHLATMDVRGSEQAVRAALSGIDALEILELVPLDADVLRVKTRSGEDARERLAAAIVEAGLGLRSLERESTALEDIFVRLSREGGEEARA